MAKVHVRKNLILFSLLVCGIVVLLLMSVCSSLAVRRYSLKSKKLLHGVSILAVTDLHSTVYGRDQSDLLHDIEMVHPDIIVLVGDIVDDKRPVEGAMEFLKAIGRRYPCFYVTGNHEFWSGQADEIKDSIRSLGITVLEGNCKIAKAQGQRIQICGIDDPDGFEEESFFGTEISPGWDQELESCEKQLDNGIYSVLLSHRPERVSYYVQSGFDLVIAGHAHGGQVRIPGLLNGLYAPNQGLFPKYAGGLYQLGKTQMVVSRGLAKSLIPRIFNPPELVLINLLPEE